MAKEDVATSKELAISLIGLVIAIVLAVLSLGIANWGIQVFGISGDIPRGAALIAVAIIIGQTIAAFANKKYF
jgi:uncharacterized membrane protein YwzB